MRTIAVAHHKGGTAKTTTTVNLAAALAEAGHRVLVIDMDPQGSASAWLGVRDPELSVINAIHGQDSLAHLVYETTAPGVQLVPASPGLVVSGPDEETDTALGFIRAMEKLPPLWDFVLVDCPPSLGYLGIAPLTVCEEVLVPVEAHVLAMAGLSSLMETIQRASTRLNPKLRVTGVLACRVNRTTHSKTVVERLARRFPESFMRTQIRENVRLAEAPSFTLPITVYAPQSSGAEDYRALAAEVVSPAGATAAAGARTRTAPVTTSIAVPPVVPTRAPLWPRIAGATFRGRHWPEIISALLPAFVLVLATFVRIWQVGAIGFNTDEAVYSGQAASLANDPGLTPFFPIFRAHPLLFQFALADLFTLTGVSDVGGRLLSAAFGVITVYLVYRLGRLLYNRTAGLIAALLLAVMPYHVIVSRQVLLDGPMTLFSVLALYAVAKYATTGERTWLYATGAAMGLTFLSKETGAILLGAIFAFFALAPSVAVRVRDLVAAVVVFIAVVAAFPTALILAGAGGSSVAQQYLVWQLFRLPNHDMSFYFESVPSAVGPLLIVAALVGLALVRRKFDWRERLLIAWVVVVVVFFELWPVKGYQYLLPIVPAVAVLAGRALAALSRATRSEHVSRRIGRVVLIGAVLASGVLSSWAVITATPRDFLAGAGALPGGREAGRWVSNHVPTGAQMMAIGPSMANVLEFYGDRKVWGLSVRSEERRVGKECRL